MTQVYGKDLRIGDTIEIWWSPGRDTITRAYPYRGPLEYLWPEGARIVEFAILKGGMTVGNGDVETLIARGGA